jgi:hypothetical protein
MERRRAPWREERDRTALALERDPGTLVEPDRAAPQAASRLMRI